MAVTNCLLAFPNRADEATLSSGSWQASLPLTNLQTRQLGVVARSTSAALTSTKFDVDLTKDRNINAVALINHNLSLKALWRVRGSTVVDFASTLYDSGWVSVWPAVYFPDDLEWEDDNWWTGQYTEEERDGYTWTITRLPTTSILARYWRVEMDDTTNTAGYVQSGRLFIGPGFQPTVNFSFGLQFGWEAKTDIQEALSGAEYFNRRTPFRTVRFRLDSLTENEAFGRALELSRRAGLDKEILYIHNPSDTVQVLRRQFLARLRQLSPIEFPTVGLNQTAFEVKELL